MFYLIIGKAFSTTAREHSFSQNASQNLHFVERTRTLFDCQIDWIWGRIFFFLEAHIGLAFLQILFVKPIPLATTYTWTGTNIIRGREFPYNGHTEYYRKRGSASYIVREVLLVREREREREREIQREREIDGSDVTIVALKLAMNLHFPLPKIRTIGDEFTLSLAKNSHFSFLPLHFPSLPLRRGHHGGAEIRNEFTLSFAKKIFALRLCSPSFKWHELRDEWSKTQDKWSNLAQSYFVLPIEKLNQINTKNYWK